MTQRWIMAKGSQYLYGLLTVAWGFGTVFGCAGPLATTSVKPQPEVPVPALTAPAAVEKVPDLAYIPTEGSLWDERSNMSEMFINSKARRIGDILTVKIIETSSAVNKASTETDRTSSLTAKIDNFFNYEERYPSTRPFFNPFSSVSGNISSDFEGSGSTKRSGTLTAYMTARIVEIMPNGNYVIEGYREVRVNNENQIINLSGIVRPRDISADNVIQSTYIADAQITYSGTGIVNDRQKPGWLTRILDHIWPF